MLQLTAVVWSGMSNVVEAKGTQWLTALVNKTGNSCSRPHNLWLYNLIWHLIPEDTFQRRKDLLTWHRIVTKSSCL